jgi:hypothetical protein
MPREAERMRRWAWSVTGTEEPSGTVTRPLEGSGVVECELMGDVLVWLAKHGPFWGIEDDREPVTIRIRALAPEENDSEDADA